MKLVQRIIKFWILLTIICLGLYIAWLNMEKVTVNIPFQESLELPLFLVAIFSYFLGATTVAVYFIFDVSKKSFLVFRLKRRLGHSEDAGETRGEDQYQLSPNPGPSKPAVAEKDGHSPSSPLKNFFTRKVSVEKNDNDSPDTSSHTSPTVDPRGAPW